MTEIGVVYRNIGRADRDAHTLTRKRPHDYRLVQAVRRELR